jgi:hypothetical protein
MWVAIGNTLAMAIKNVIVVCLRRDLESAEELQLLDQIL